MGGVATGVENYLKPNTTKVAEGEGNDEYLTTRLSYVQPPVNIVNLYGVKKVVCLDRKSWKAGTD